MHISNRKITVVANLNPGFRQITEPGEVAKIKKILETHVEPGFSLGYDSFFVKMQDGEYAQIWGMVGTVPRGSNLATQLL